MTEWVIKFCKRDSGERGYAVVFSVPMLLDWIARNASTCREVRIVRKENQ